MGRGWRRSGIVSAAALALASAMVACGALLIRTDAAQHERVDALAGQVLADRGDGATSGVDWDSLAAANPDVVGWLSVGGTSIDTAVVRASADDPDRYLTHDLWGNRSSTGWPYLAAECDPDGRSMVVYGHRTLYEDFMFHGISGAWRQDAFDGVGAATWLTPAAGGTAFAPLCAASVEMTDRGWQHVGGGTAELREWLSWAVENSDARAAGAAGLAASASRALVLVTCNGRLLHPTTRTVAIFVAD